MIARYGSYHCLVRVHEPFLLIQRVRDELFRNDKTLHIHCAEISYNRGIEVDKQKLNSQKFHFNVFHKDKLFAKDMEYRFSLTDVSIQSKPEPFVEVMVGKRSDIMSIEELPN